jgi:putative spermidine/putrescine transport system substrate-binding protein
MKRRDARWEAIMSILKSFYEKDLYPEIEEAIGSSYARDCIELAAERLARGEINRRSFVAALSLLAAGPLALHSAKARAAGKELVLVNWGGLSIPAYTQAFGKPYEDSTGTKVAIDGTGPLPAKVRAMVESKKVVWDLLDFDASKAFVLDSDGLLEKIDYSIVDAKKVYPGWAYPAGVAYYIYSSVIGYDAQKLTTKPNDWKDFWDLKKFPGRRALRRTPEGGIEACMMAAGRSIKDVYPVDLPLAVSKVRELKPELITWNTGSQSQDVLRNGEVVMCQLWHSRAIDLFKKEPQRFSWTWNQGLMNVDVWSVVKNNPAGREEAMKFIAFTQDPARQVELFKILSNGPVNPAAAALVPEDMKRFDPTQPENQAVQAVLNPAWWNEPSGKGNLSNDALAREMWLDAVS